MCVSNHSLLLTQECLCNPNWTLPRCVHGVLVKADWGKETHLDLIVLWTKLMQYRRTELSWASFVSLCPVFLMLGLSSWFVPLELLSLPGQSSSSLRVSSRCSLCSLIPTLLSFSADWDLAFSRLLEQSQRLYQDNSSFHQLFIKLISLPCDSQFFSSCGDLYPY